MIDDFRRPTRPQSVRPSAPPVTVEPSTTNPSDQPPISSSPDQFVQHLSSMAVANTLPSGVPRKKHLFARFAPVGQWVSNHRLLSLIIIGVCLVSVAAASCYALVSFYHPAVKQYAVIKIKPKPPVPPKPTIVASTLSGLPVDPSVNGRPVTAVMVENSTFARPQSGLDAAGVVFEAEAEGGVTRFMALYQDTQPDYIGPVRSARPYYIQWLLGFDAAYAHVGGSPDALQDIPSWHVKDLNEFYNAGAYERITSRYAPHNVYTSIAQLNQVEGSKGYTTSSFTGFVRKPESPSKAPNATSIDMTFSGPIYNAHFDYDASTNTYKRSEGGSPHMELNKDGSQVQLAPKVVIGMVVPLTQGALDSTGAYYSNYATIGSGTALVFQDGIVTTGTWTKSSNTSQISFTNANGQPLALNPGQTWICAVASANDATYK